VDQVTDLGELRRRILGILEFPVDVRPAVGDLDLSFELGDDRVDREAIDDQLAAEAAQDLASRRRRLRADQVIGRHPW